MKAKRNEGTEKKIFNVLQKEGIPDALALLVVAQSKHETAVAGVPYMSKQFLVNNNCFGYGFVPGNSLQLQDGGKHPEDGGHYAKYSSIENSAKDIAGWYKRRKEIFFGITDSATFAQALKNAHYYTDAVANYAHGVKNFYQSKLV